MSRTITALFDTKDDALAGRQRLIDANIDADHIRVQDKSHLSDDSYAPGSNASFWESNRNAYLPDEDRHSYEEGMRRGGYLLTADVDEDDIDEAIRALETTPAVDLDERAVGWRQEGWKTPAYKDGMSDETLQVVEEQLVVGKRETDRGGVRVRSYVTERPVHEQIALRKERVNVERRPVSGTATVGADAFEEKTIEMTTSSEEAVVGKQARVVEEVVLSKDVDVVQEDVEATVRRKDVEVEQLGTTPVAPGKPRT